MSRSFTLSARVFAAIWTKLGNGNETEDAERRHVHGCNCGIRPDGDSGQRPRAQHTGSARMNNAIAAELVQRGFGEGGP